MNPRAFALPAILAAALTAAPTLAYPTREGHPVRYVIITSDALAPAFQPLADWKTQAGLPAIVRPLSAVLADHPVAWDDAERVRLEIRDAWAAGAEWVLLGGDAGVVPARYARSAFYGGADLLTDLYFQCLAGDWDDDGDHVFGEAYFSESAPGDSADLTPEVWLGRAPVSTLAEAGRFVQKTLQYQRTPAGDYEHRSLECAEVVFPVDWSGGTPTLDGAELVEPLLPLFDLHPSLSVTRLYENYLDPRWRPGALPETRAAVLAAMNGGANQALVVGHGFIHEVSVGDAPLTEADLAGLTNGARLMNLWLLGSTGAPFDPGGTGRAAVLAPAGGAVTALGTTGFEFPVASRHYMHEFHRLVYADGVNALGEALGRSRLPFVPFAAVDGVHRWTQMTLVLLGDPELRMFTGPPRALVVTHAPVVTLEDTGLDVLVATGGAPLAGARVAAWRAGEFLGVAVTDAAGQAQVPIAPQTMGTFLLTVTAHDARPYEAEVTILSPPTPTLISLVSAEARFDGVTLLGHTPSGAGAVVTIERADGGEPWREVARTAAEAGGRVRWEDGAVEAATTYRYRLGVADGGATHYSAAIEVTVPARPVLALRVRGPQPVTGAVEVELALADVAPARLQMVDAAGRRVLTREVGALGPGRHLLTLGAARDLAPGVYWLSLEQGGRMLTTRAVVLR